MQNQTISPMIYVLIDLMLILLTIATVALSFMPENGSMHLLGGLAIAIVKASLVVLFFMHALHSRAQTKAVIAVSIFWLCVVMIALIFSDYTTRNLIPNMPGH